MAKRNSEDLRNLVKSAGGDPFHMIIGRKRRGTGRH